MYKRLGDKETSMQAFKYAANLRHADAVYELALAKRKLLDDQIVDMSKWVLIASKLGPEQAKDEKQLFKSYLPSRDFLNKGKSEAKKWLKEHDTNDAKKFSEDAKKVAEGMSGFNQIMDAVVDLIGVDKEKLNNKIKSIK